MIERSELGPIYDIESPDYWQQFEGGLGIVRDPIPDIQPATLTNERDQARCHWTGPDRQTVLRGIPRALMPPELAAVVQPPKAVARVTAAAAMLQMMHGPRAK